MITSQKGLTNLIRFGECFEFSRRVIVVMPNEVKHPQLTTKGDSPGGVRDHFYEKGFGTSF